MYTCTHSPRFASNVSIRPSRIHWLGMSADPTGAVDYETRAKGAFGLPAAIRAALPADDYAAVLAGVVRNVRRGPFTTTAGVVLPCSSRVARRSSLSVSV